MSADSSSFDQAPLTPAVFHILLALADGERHGYGIMQEALRQSGGRFRMGAGTLYGTLDRLLKLGWVEESDDRPHPEEDDQRRRRYYRLGKAGRSALQAELARMNALLRHARRKLIWQPHGGH